MSSKALSPTANLLRTSRLFSLPPHLPRPFLDFQASTGADASSRSATLPYPIQQAIETPSSSLSRGDWGLKRPLPLRSTTRTRNPTVRLIAVDTIEHVTDFESASDHSMTLQKWQAMEIPMMTNVDRPRSVYEEDYDNTDSTNTDGFRRRRWKFDGPWLAGMDPNEFETYLTGVVGGRKEEFRNFLRGKLRDMEISFRKNRARQKGLHTLMLDNQSASEHVEIDDANLDISIHAFRDEYNIGSNLVKFIREFLDLPEMPTSSAKDETYFNTFRTRSIDSDVLPTARQSPSKTHPGAGLSYIRTGSFLTNHPILGPRAHHQPVPARVLKQRFKMGASGHAIIGVGGVLTREPKVDRVIKVGMPLDGSVQAAEVGLAKPDFTRPGGTKIWVEPQSASVDSEGMVELVVIHADRTNVGYHTGEEIAAFLQRPIGTSLMDRAQPLVPSSSGTGFDSPLDSAQYQIKTPRQKALNSQETLKLLEEVVMPRV